MGNVGNANPVGVFNGCGKTLNELLVLIALKVTPIRGEIGFNKLAVQGGPAHVRAASAEEESLTISETYQAESFALFQGRLDALNQVIKDGGGYGCWRCPVVPRAADAGPTAAIDTGTERSLIIV